MSPFSTHYHQANKLIISDWDPTKWIIYILHIYTPLVPTLARTPESSITKARARMHMAEADRLFGTVKADEMAKDPSQLPVWTKNEVIRKHGEWVDERRRVLLILEGCVVDVGGYLEDHVCLPLYYFEMK
jgi:stearoyl-CoA desaturase (delta-9 desaturase)